MSISITPYYNESAANAFTEKISSASATDAAANPLNGAASSEFAAILNERTAALASEHESSPSKAEPAAASPINSQTGQPASLKAPSDLEAVFDEAAAACGVSKNLLKSIAKAESNFNPSAVSSAGAIGVMQLMPKTAASLGVSNPYDARENIMGGARLISSLLAKYNGNTSLALAAYNAGSGNVDKYGGIPPFAETQNYVRKVLNGIGENIQIPPASSSPAAAFGLTGSEKTQANQMLEYYFGSHGITKDSLDLIMTLIKLNQSLTPSE